MDQANVVEIEDSIWKQKAEWSFTEAVVFALLCVSLGCMLGGFII